MSDSAFAQFFSQPLLQAFEGSGRCSYSNLSYFLVGRIISEVSGTSAPTYITENILQPLNLSSTFWNADRKKLPECACGYRWNGASWLAEELIPTQGDGAVFAALWSSLRDLAIWLDFLRADSNGKSNYQAVLSSSSRREMQGSYSWIAPTTFTRSENSQPLTAIPRTDTVCAMRSLMACTIRVILAEFPVMEAICASTLKPGWVSSLLETAPIALPMNCAKRCLTS